MVKGYGRLTMLVSVCAVTVVISLLEGLNIGLLVPLLETLDGPGRDGGHWISRGIFGVFDTLSIPVGLGSILVVLSVLMLGIAALKYMRLLMVARLSRGFMVWLRATYMRQLLRADMTHYHAEKMGVMTDTLKTQVDRSVSSVQTVTDLVSNSGLVLAYLIAAFLITPSLAAVAFGMLVAVALMMQRYVSWAKTLGAELVDRDYDFQVASIENLSGIQVVKSFVLEKIRGADFNRKTEAVGDTWYRLTKYSSQMVVLQELALFGIIGAIVYVGVSVMGLELAVIVALLFVLYRMAPRVNSLNIQRQGLAVSLAALHSVKVAMDKASEPTIVSGTQRFTGLHQGIELRNVNFSFNGGAPVLEDANFTIAKGSMTAIIGSSGAGKSTLLDLLLRLYDPVTGAVLVDGIDMRELDLASWLDSVGVVSQDIFLFNDTVENNISLGRNGVTHDDVVEATRKAYAHDFIEQMPKGYETPLGDRGVNLSGGQRQRIALARAILKNPEILILDEATSALDSESEGLIQQYIQQIRGVSTIIAVAHRISTIRDADKIAVLEDGKITREGTWDSLAMDSELFANYQRLQSGG